MTETEVRNVCAQLGLRITQLPKSYRIQGDGVNLHVAALGHVLPEDLDPVLRRASVVSRPGRRRPK